MPPPHLRLIETVTPAPAGPPQPSPASAPVFRTTPCRAEPKRRPLGQILLDMQAVDPGNLLRALALRSRQEVPLGDILLGRGWLREPDLIAALCLQWNARAVDLIAAPPDPRLIDRLGSEFCLRHAVMPWRQSGGTTVIVTARPDGFEHVRTALPPGFGPVSLAIAPESDIQLALTRARAVTLARRAETRVPEEESCRGQTGASALRIVALGLATLAAGLLVQPQATIGLLSLWAIVTLIATTALKAAAGFATFRTESRDTRPPAPPLPAKLPVVSVMVPLFREDDIVPRLIERLGRLDYPKELLDILLVVEADDKATRGALSRHPLPRWMRVVTVPDGRLRTKPRALNFALDFCRGAIIGVWDAEDKPDPGQLTEVVRRFAAAAPEVACLQGVLDFYNSRHNWLTRCFTIDYAIWFRVVLPGLARLGMVVPLGGTTLFFRREVIEKLGGWDAHNVTEDADLGLRLARYGYRTELIPTVTEEEPNSRVLAWLKQRSRWQKGYAMTWASHMRAPSRLWRDLGPKRFVGVQILFLGALTDAVLTPVLLSYWLLALGLPHPLAGAAPAGLIAFAGLLFAFSEMVSLSVGLWALLGRRHRHLMLWLPVMHFYAPLASLSSYKALWEWVSSPFYWDKTSHGVVEQEEEAAAETSVLVLTDPVWLPLPPAASVVPLHALRGAPGSRLHFRALPADRITTAGVPPAGAAPGRLHPVNLRTRQAAASAVSVSALRSGIELQAGFEGL